ncbi:ubiquitin carboxyl-terminal hydrolase 21-like isoform X2 [Phalaenopsis equestris]|uniref:ubiquitin carboxyl-terminal hydrolase 21-like isoform X2 n=1 Tax=Phalaenopsis equestris TaxID=78828 RepID=UPI0009E3430A|nr:ubiquitin carboxyl-terminal hydrolase 21-like isoform X2 [Phalaenopsis equestris]
MEAPILALPYRQIGPETENLQNATISPAASRFPQHIVGAALNNLGNTCFMNAVLQCITHTVPLVEKLRDNSHSPACSDKDGDFCSFCALRVHVNQSITKSGFVVTPRSFAYNLSKISSYFQLGEQQDAHEFLSCFLDSIHTSYLKPIHKDYPPSSSKESPVNQVFRGLLRSQLRCLDCGHCSDTYEPIVDLSLEIDDVDNLTDALLSFTKAEMIDDPVIKITCEGCKAQVSMEKQLKIEQPPNVIALHLKRFMNTESSVRKICEFVEYPLELDLMPFLSSPRENEQLLYELYGIVVHSGSCYYGHYYSNIRTSPTTWYQMNDSMLDVISESQVLEEEAYILFYIKKGSSPWFKSFVESQKICRSGMDMKGSPLSVLDHEDNDETSSARETSSSISREAAREMLEKDEVCSPHASSSSGFPIDEPQADNPATQRLPNNSGNKNGDSSSLPSSSVTQTTNQPASDQLLSLVFKPEPLEDDKENRITSLNHGSLKASSNQSKLNTVINTDRSLTRIMKGMPTSRRLGLLACLQGLPEPGSKQPLASKSAPPLKKRKSMSSDLPPLNGKESPHHRSTKAKSLSPHSIRRCLIEDDSDMSFEFGSGDS